MYGVSDFWNQLVYHANYHANAHYFRSEAQSAYFNGWLKLARYNPSPLNAIKRSGASTAYCCNMAVPSKASP